MPPCSPPARVLVTGANGYIGLWVIRFLLQRGFSVRGIVRNVEKGHTLERLLHSKESQTAQSFEFAIVDDLTKERIFDEVVRDVDVVIHTASPVRLNPDTWRDTVDPAVKGTQGILKSILKHGYRIKRVVITSSAGAVLVDTEDKVRWDLTTICPSMVFGPLPDDPASPAALTFSMNEFWTYVMGPEQGAEVYLNTVNNFVDVRDLAEVHVRALQVPEAGGERIIASSGPYTMQDWHEILGVDLRGMYETCKDIIEDFRQRGWIN
ncbi:hypothetical protein CERSUDRAFT_69472 [Gelatoporia subvermispora B]|uniref:3-beta hydroxysteroid dehydrogenase/isomerase domain-containing protein n=1 Tax=Ceriporiopsis subvermispora (strain B) TaxID=914234 RepID=M2QGP1_CERS8|nr:hypothetical protein CERSUDRAFT_69472 [Gelatoporia subvermispora B]